MNLTCSVRLKPTRRIDADEKRAVVDGLKKYNIIKNLLLIIILHQSSSSQNNNTFFIYSIITCITIVSIVLSANRDSATALLYVHGHNTRFRFLTGKGDTLLDTVLSYFFPTTRCKWHSGILAPSTVVDKMKKATINTNYPSITFRTVL